MGTRLRAVLIGVGAVAELIARSLAEVVDVALVGGSCRTRAKGEQFAQQFACDWFDDYARMLDRTRPDFAIISTPSGAHLEPALACAARGVHVLCEKPLEITVERAAQMIAAAERAGIQLGGIFPLRFSPVVRALYDAAAAGRFGDLAVVAASVPWWRDDAYYGAGRWQGTRALDGGGALMNQAIHTIDLVQWIAKAASSHEGSCGGPINPVAEVTAFTAQRGHAPVRIEVEDTAVVSLRFRCGAVGQILAATSMYPGSLRRLLVGGRDGTAEILEDQLVTFRFRNAVDEDEATRARFGAATAHGGGAANPMAFGHLNHRRNVESFVQALHTGRSPSLDGHEAVKAIAIVEAAYASHACGGRPIPVAPRISL